MMCWLVLNNLTLHFNINQKCGNKSYPTEGDLCVSEEKALPQEENS